MYLTGKSCYIKVIFANNLPFLTINTFALIQCQKSDLRVEKGPRKTLNRNFKRKHNLGSSLEQAKMVGPMGVFDRHFQPQLDQSIFWAKRRTTIIKYLEFIGSLHTLVESTLPQIPPPKMKKPCPPAELPYSWQTFITWLTFLKYR